MKPLAFRFALPLLALPLLAGCVNDSASYAFPEKNHAITLIRNQAWPWDADMELGIAVARQPDCDGGSRVKAVPMKAEISLFKAPDDYAEPIFILRVDKRDYAISTLSCQVQEFKEPPPDVGTRLGGFKEKDGKFAFVAEGA